MIPVIINDPRLKEKCQIFTPDDIVTQMLDLADYRSQVVGKTVLENCCGDGQFLIQIIERYIIDATQEGYSAEDIALGLERDIVAYEIDKTLIESCKKRLDAIALEHSLRAICWNIKFGNFLDKDVAGQFDYIIGNPPYIAYQDLPDSERKELKKEFSTCKKGKFDYSYAFIEKSYGALVHGGKLVYIIPSNIFKNIFAEEIRDLIKSDLTAVVDFPQDRVFSDVLVSPAIIVVEKNAMCDLLTYTRIVDNKSSTKHISKDKLTGKWVFDAVNTSGKRVGNYFKVSNSIATLCNRVFVLKEGHFEAGYFCVGADRIESPILRKATSPKSKRYSKEKPEFIIFPYRYSDDGLLLHYDDKEFRERFPHTTQYLERHKVKLQERDSDDSAKWFEYGRSQALQNMNQKMIMISSVISEDTRAYLLLDGEIPYAGLYIIPTGEITLEDLLAALNSDGFKKYVSSVGVSVSGSSKRITTKDVENFVF